MVDKPQNIVTKDALDHLKADRKNDPAIQTYDYPRPSWMDNADDPNRVHQRMRERHIRYIENRLDRAGRNFEREFDQNS